MRYKNKISRTRSCSIPMPYVLKSTRFSMIGVYTLAFLTMGILGINTTNYIYAYDIGTESYAVLEGTIDDYTTVSPVSGGTSTPPTASLTLSNSNMASSAVTPGSTATTSTNVTVSVSNAASYSLTLSFAKTTLTGTTTINAGNAVNDNTWGYKWDNAANYSTPSTTGSTLTVPALSNDSASFTKTLAFAAKFATNAEAGHYTNTGTLSLVASPKTATYTLADLTQMQQITPEICANTPYISGKKYSETYTLVDVRDNARYTVARLDDGRCWMTNNLKLSSYVFKDDGGIKTMYTGGRILSPATSGLASNWTLPASNTAGFSDNAASNMYYNSSNNIGYYTWCAATAGTCTSTTSDGQNALSSICPKGWRLPSGSDKDRIHNNEFYDLFNNMDKSYFQDNELKASGSTGWSSIGLSKVQASPYNFAYTGNMDNNSFYNGSVTGTWWSGTALNDTYAYTLSIGSNNLYPGLYNGRRYGNAIRCIAQ